MNEKIKKHSNRHNAGTLRHQPIMAGDVYKDLELGDFSPARNSSHHFGSGSRNPIFDERRRSVRGCVGRNSRNTHHNSLSAKSVRLVSHGRSRL